MLQDIIDYGICLNTTTDGKAQCLRATCYKDGIRNLVANTVDRRTCVAELVMRGDGSATFAVPSKYENGIPVKAISSSDGKEYDVYCVKNGVIYVKGIDYPIELNDGHYIIHKLSVNECRKLQTVPDWFEFPVSNSQAFKLLGNGWTCMIISHLVNATINNPND